MRPITLFEIRKDQTIIFLEQDVVCKRSFYKNRKIMKVEITVHKPQAPVKAELSDIAVKITRSR